MQILLLQILQMCYLEFLHFLKSSYSFKPRSFTQIYFVDYGKIKFEPPSVSLYYKNLSEIQNFIQTRFSCTHMIAGVVCVRVMTCLTVIVSHALAQNMLSILQVFIFIIIGSARSSRNVILCSFIQTSVRCKIAYSSNSSSFLVSQVILSSL